MDKIIEWKNLIVDSLSAMTNEVGNIIPNLFAAIFVFIIGWILNANCCRHC